MSVVDCHMLLGSGTGWWDLTHGGSWRPPVPGQTRVKFEVSQVLEECSRAGIDRACVVSPVNDSYEAANRYIADACEKHPDKLIGIAAHSPYREEGKIAKLLTTEVRSMGLKAVRSEGHPSRELLDTVRELRDPADLLSRAGADARPGTHVLHAQRVLSGHSVHSAAHERILPRLYRGHGDHPSRQAHAEPLL